jgi:hypothetical protein
LPCGITVQPLCIRVSHSLDFITWQASFVGAMAIADLVKTTLGPKGMVRPLVVLHFGVGQKMAVI